MTEGDHESEGRGWLPLVAIAAVVCFVCSGAATAIAGPKVGVYVVITLLVLFGVFIISSAISAALLRNRGSQE